MSGHSERAQPMRGAAAESRSFRRPVQPRFRADESQELQHRDAIIRRQNLKLTQYREVAARIIKEVSEATDEAIDDVSPGELVRVIDYLKIMKSSVEVLQTINEALKGRIDELVTVSAQDGQILQSLWTYMQSLPVMRAVRDERTNEHVFRVDFPSEHTIQVHRSDSSAVSEMDERECPSGKKTRWVKNALSAALCLLVGTSIVKAGFGRGKCGKGRP